MPPGRKLNAVDATAPAAVGTGLPPVAGARTADAATLLLSVHLPKTAGTSFAQSLQARFGAGYRADYADLPMQVGAWRRQWHAMTEGLRMRREGADVGTTCIHGHFLPVKYRFAALRRPVGVITWLRDPVERVVSHYHFWRRDYAGDDPAQPLRNRMLAEDWSLERFALGPELRNVYHAYLWGFPASRFDFIGITEHYADELERLAETPLVGDLHEARALVNPDRECDRYDVPAGMRRRIEAWHASDVALYRWALARRGARG